MERRVIQELPIKRRWNDHSLSTDFGHVYTSVTRTTETPGFMLLTSCAVGKGGKKDK